MESSHRLRSNIAANMAGRLASTVLAVVFTPLYINFLGIEAYGLVGFYVTLQAALSFLELGLSYTCNRELAKHSGKGASASQIMLNILRSLEVVYWGIALLIGLVLTFSASVIASEWIHSKAFSSDDLENIVIVMAWVMALRWPVGLYEGALSGLQKQVSMNIVLVVVAVLNWAGAALVLWLFDATIHAFFLWQLLVSVVSVMLFASLAWFCMPGKFFQGKFSYRLLMNLMPFTMAIGANAILGAILTQADKLIVSAMVPLKTFAYYALASMIAETVILLANPVSNAIFPKMAQMVGRGAKKIEMATFFHLSAQSVNIVVAPLGLILAVFSNDVLTVYTGSPEIAGNAALVLSIMVIAKMLHANMLVPYALLLSIGKLKLSVYLNAASVCFFLPLIILLARNYGLAGAAASWLLITLGYVFIGMPLILKQYFDREWGRWVLSNILVPFLLIAPMLWVMKVFLSIYDLGRWETAGTLVFTGILAALMTVVLLPSIRAKLKQALVDRGIK